MGTYLSTPVLDKVVVTGEDLECEETPLVYGCVDMQGWRKSMEDAHVANTNIPLSSAEDSGSGEDDGNEADDANKTKPKERAKMFGVFDGHGGPEVARFCQRHIVDVMVLQPKWQQGNVAGALVDTFHAMDRLVDDPDRKAELYELRNSDAGTDCGNYDAQHYRPAKDSLGLVQKADPSQIYGVYNTTTTTIISSTDVLEVSDSENESDDADHEAKKMIHTSTDPIEIKDTILDEAQAESSDASVSTLDSMSECDGVSDDSSIDSDYDAGEKTEKRVKNDALAKEAEASKNEQLSQEDALALFQKLLNIDADAVDSDEVKMEGVQFNKESNSITLTLSKPDENIESAKSEVTIEDSMSLDDSLSEDESRKESSDCDEKGTQKSDDEASAESPVAEPSVEEAVPFLASRIINGRQVCNLSDHNIQAGCTSIVAVLVGRTLTVANAGDSRAVLCRAGGITHPLSFDHKPQQEREMNRILNAGGFVNQFGRVNGNLNLSRSIGDLKYKQTPGIPPDQQMITSEPDITSVELQDGDEFLIIGCDGIWDCLTNEGAVKYVKDRIDTKRCEDILREMLDEIISDDPRASQGIGGDNMTCMIVDLLPHARAHYAYQSEEQEPSPLAIVEAEEMKSGEMAEELV